jgi:hypothetical protein
MLLDLPKHVLSWYSWGLPKLVFKKTNKKFDANSHRRSETKLAKRSLTSTKPTYDGKKEVLVPIYRK